jgi:hypothetical protein
MGDSQTGTAVHDATLKHFGLVVVIDHHFEHRGPGRVGKKRHDMRVARASSSRRVRAAVHLARLRQVVSQGAAARAADNDDEVVVSGHCLFSLLGRGR